MKYNKLGSKPDIQAMQENTIKFWKDEDIFSKSLENKTGEKIFYDGPPFPTGKPHHGTVLVSFIKDMIARYHTMRGYSVPRVWGWDCHGLPIETQAEAALGIKNKNEIEGSVGVDVFNDACYDIVSQNNEAWKTYVDEMARWVDYDGAYKTMNLSYMESVIWTFKQCYDKGLIYQDYRVTPYCYRCETSLSISDTRESDSTRPRQDTWVIAKFNTDKEIDGKKVYFMAWTTTPWTLPSNMALAVGKDINYVYALVGDDVYIMCEEAVKRYPKQFGENPEILKKCKGSDLVGETYIPLFSYFAEKASEGAFKVIAADFVASDEGIGIVHIAPAFGEDDYWACKGAGVPLVNPVDSKGLFTAEITDFAGRNVMEANSDIIRFLKGSNNYIADGSIEHNYPHCWRCRTPLIYKAMEAWYFSIDKIKDRLLELNEQVNWIPETVKHGRFGNWLANARDWNISRNRYWSTPIPVWECECCGKRKVLGSLAEIEKMSGVSLTDLHKQYVDKITFDCECGHTMKRIPEVLDCWFESASVPHAQKHYPFENKEWFETHYPCDFVVEYTGQIRCWFYYLHVIAAALFDKPAFKNCVVHGTVLAKDRKKLSKSSKNYTDPMELMKKYGTDAFRLYMYQSNAMLIGDLLFDESGLQTSLQQILLPLWNSCGFYTSYAIIDDFCPDKITAPKSDNQLDRWILAKLYDTTKNITENMDDYQVDKYIGFVVSLIDGITNWYIRRSRKRFWATEFTGDKQSAYETLLYVLVNTCKLLAPVAPIISEELYKHLTGELSVHLADWPKIPEEFCDSELLLDVDLVQEVIHLARSIRTKNNVKNRQPLSKLSVAFSNEKHAEIIKKSSAIICEELNVKEMLVIKDAAEISTVKYLPNFTTLGPKYGNTLPQIIKAINQKKFVIDGGKVTISLDEQDLILEESDIIVDYKAKEGQHVAGGSGIVVSLDLTITDALKREGIAREIVRNIQDSRKNINCDIMDNITISFKGEPVPEEWVEYILSETLSILDETNEPDAVCEVAGQNDTIIVEIKRILK